MDSHDLRSDPSQLELGLQAEALEHEQWEALSLRQERWLAELELLQSNVLWGLIIVKSYH
jgi:hypothetical protein